MKQPQLLLIDDEPALADFVASAAREIGFDPTITSNDANFREAFQEKRPDAVALDLGMPVMRSKWDAVGVTRPSSIMSLIDPSEFGLKPPA